MNDPNLHPVSELGWKEDTDTHLLEPVWSEGTILPERLIYIVADIIQCDGDEESSDREDVEEIDQDELSDDASDDE